MESLYADPPNSDFHLLRLDSLNGYLAPAIDLPRQPNETAADHNKRVQAAGKQVADHLNSIVGQRLEQISSILALGVGGGEPWPFATMYQSPPVADFAPSTVAASSPPDRGSFAPPSGVSLLGKLPGGAGWQRRSERRAEERFAVARAEWESEQLERVRVYEDERRRHEAELRFRTEQVEAYNQVVGSFEAGVQGGDSVAVEAWFSVILARQRLPEGFPREYRVAYRPEPRELWVEVELPETELIPPAASYKYVHSRREIDIKRRPGRDREKLYASALAQLALRLLNTCFSADARDVIDSVVFSGHVRGRDPATGKKVRPCLLSVSAERTTFDELELAHLDPNSCLKHLNAIVSPHPADLEAVPPVVDFDLAKFKFADEIDAAAELDSRSDLIKMDPFRFEHLIRQLFEEIGMKSWVTQASRDDGIDGVAVHEDPILGGVCVIQAKRYSKVVPANDVRALWGAMEDKHATKGILVTTSWFGSSSREFVARHQERLRLIEGPELKHLLAEHLDLDVRIDLPKRPRRLK